MNNLLELKKTRAQQAVNFVAAQKKRIEKGRWEGAILFEIKQPDNHGGQPRDSKRSFEKQLQSLKC